METIILAKILASLEWYGFSCHNDNICDYIKYRYEEILRDSQDIFNHLYLEL